MSADLIISAILLALMIGIVRRIQRAAPLHRLDAQERDDG